MLAIMQDERVRSRAVRVALLDVAARRLGVVFPTRFAQKWAAGDDVPGGAPPSEWAKIQELARQGDTAAVDGVGFPIDGEPDFYCLIADGTGLSEVIHYWSHESRVFEAVKPWLAADLEGASWRMRELDELSPLSRRTTTPSMSSAAPAPFQPSRDGLALAARIERVSQGGTDDLAALLGSFESMTGSKLPVWEFSRLCTANPASLVERVVLVPTKQEDPGTISRQGLIDILRRAHDHGLDFELAVEAFSGRTQLPRHIAEQLATGGGQLFPGWPSVEHIVDFGLAFVLPTSAESVWSLARAWASDTAQGSITVPSAFGAELLRAALAEIRIPELLALLNARTETKRRTLHEQLGLALAPAAEPTEVLEPQAPAPRAPIRVRHVKFGDGVVIDQEGEGPAAKLTIAFESGTKRLQASFVRVLDAQPF